MTKKKSIILRVTAAVVAFALIALIASIANASMGNPISARIADRAIAKYVKDNYSFLDLKIEKCHYNFKFSEYSAKVWSRTSKDTHFNINCSNGKVKYDDYQSAVIEKFNTITRLADEYSALAKSIISKELGYNDVKVNVSLDKEKDLRESDLIKLDMPFDRAVKLDSSVAIRLNMNDINVDKGSNLLINVHKTFIKNECIFNKYTLYVENDGELMTFRATAKDIQSGQLTNLLSQEKDSKHYGDAYVDIHKKDK